MSAKPKAKELQSSYPNTNASPEARSPKQPQGHTHGEPKLTNSSESHDKKIAKHQRRLQIEGRFYDAMGQWLIEYNPETHELTNLGEHEEEDESETATRQTARRLKNSFELGFFYEGLLDLYNLHPELSESSIRRVLSENPDMFKKDEDQGRGWWTLTA